MACLAKNCTITGADDRMVVCWLCHECCHFNCSGLPVVVAEALPNNKGLHWCCSSCSNIGANFSRFFQNTRTKYLELQSEATKLTERISAYGKLFDDFKSLDNLKSPPQPSPKRRKSPRNVNKDKCDEFHAVEMQLPLSSKSSVQHGAKSTVKSVLITPVLNIPVDNNTPSTANADNDPVSVVNNDPASVVNNELLANLNNSPLGFTQNKETSVSIPYVPSLINSQVVHNSLRAIPPKKAVFVSRLAFDTTVADVEFYIKSKIGSNAEISTFKFKHSQPREIASFKVIVPDQYFKIIHDPAFWPTNTFVREFTYRENRNTAARLPSRNTNVSKN